MAADILDFKSIKTALEDAEPITYKRDDYSGCRHKQTTIDFHNRNVSCRGCGVVLDPYAVLQQIAAEFSGWKVKQLKESVVRLEALESKLEKRLQRNLMTEEENKLSALEFRANHYCDPERMWRKGDMIYCFCGSGFNRHSFPKRALEVFEAHQRLALKAQFQLKKWS